MSQEMIVEFIKLIPSVLWIFLVAIVIAAFYKPIREILPKMSNVEAFGIKLIFIQELDRAIGTWQIHVSEGERSQLSNRVRRLAPLLRGVRILWIDDRPGDTINERSMLASLGMHVDLVQTSTEGQSKLPQTKYDAFISDIQRNRSAGENLLSGENLNHGEGPKIGEGLRFLQETPELHYRTILYIGKFKPEKGVPPYAFGITDRPDQLLHLVLDILERKPS